MDCHWIKVSASLKKGIGIINQLESTKFEQFLRRIVAKLKLQDVEIFTEEERRKLEKIFQLDEETLLMAIKTIIYIFKRILKFVFMPVCLKTDLRTLGLNDEKSEIMVKVWSAETKNTVSHLGSDEMFKHGESLNFSWKLNAELSSDTRKKAKIPKAYISLTSKSEDTEVEMTHKELYSVFLQFEAVQNELDNLM